MAAFTLLEVLVATAIISLLAAVLLPGLRAARVQSRRVACAANLRQAASGWHHYLDAHRGRFLRGINANLNYGGKQGGGGPMFEGPKPLNKYLGLPTVTGRAELFACPCDQGAQEIQPTFHDFVGTSYDTNPYLIGQDDFFIYSSDPCKDVLERLRRRMRDLNRSGLGAESRLLLMGDVGWVEAAHFNSELKMAWHERSASYNLAFMDGHAEFLKIRKGLPVTSRYTLIPFQDLQRDAATVQKEVIAE